MSETVTNAVVRIEERLRGNLELAMREGDRFFAGRSSGWTTLRKLANRFDESQISYAAIGTFALFHHGFRQYMEGIDVLIDDLQRLEQLRPEFLNEANPRHWIDVDTGVSIRFALAGDPPSGVAWKSYRFPDPQSVFELGDGIRFVNLPTLISIMLAAWLGNGRLTRDLANTQELIKELYLTESLADQLHADVREEYVRICRVINHHCGDYLRLWPLPVDSRPPTNMDELIALNCPSGELEAMRSDGIEVFAKRPYYEHYVLLSTSNRIIARRFDMHHESEHYFKD